MNVRQFRKSARYNIELPGLATDSVPFATIDGKYAILQIHPSYTFAILVKKQDPDPPFEKIVFYTNCLIYEHELPAFIVSKPKRILVKPIQTGAKSYLSDRYYENLAVACEALNSIRLGPLICVYFRYPARDEYVDLPYTNRYTKVSKELSLYASAMRQLDPLTEFLGYYRIIESTTNSNGKSWIRSNLNRLKAYNFGRLDFIDESVVGKSGEYRRTNLFSRYRRRAVLRLNELSSTVSGGDVAQYLFNENRCGIAHGKTGIKVFDYGHDVMEVGKDIYVIKLLARIAISDKAGLANGSVL